MDCHRVRMLLNAYIDRELDFRTERKVRNHLTECPECYEEYLEYMSVKAAVADIEEARPSEEFCSRLKDLFENESELNIRVKHIKCICHSSDNFFRRRGWIVAAIVTALACAGAASVLVGTPRHEGPSAVYYSMSQTEAEKTLAGEPEYPYREENFETQSRLCERILLGSSRRTDPRKLYRVVYRSR